MDYSLVQDGFDSVHSRYEVLILVVMDYSLVLLSSGLSKVNAKSVLILVVMDYSLVLDLIRQH